jgi:RNA polymerase sigma factor (TIGR02999 family)
MDDPQDITQMLNSWRNGDESALNKLMPAIYSELHKIAAGYLSKERPDHTLQATALIHEAYLQLVKDQDSQWQNRKHFFRAAAQVMRHILVNHALARKTDKRGGAEIKYTLDEAIGISEGKDWDIVALNDALNNLAKFDARKSQLVELRFFGGFSLEEIAEMMETSLATVNREWRLTKAWLHGEIKKSQ